MYSDQDLRELTWFDYDRRKELIDLLKSFRSQASKREFIGRFHVIDVRGRKRVYELDASNVRTDIAHCIYLLRDLDRAVELRRPGAAAHISCQLLFTIAHLLDLFSVTPSLERSWSDADRWQRQLSVLAANRARAGQPHSVIQRDFVKLTSSHAWRNHFVTLTKPRGIYEQLAKKHGLSSSQVRRIVRPHLAAAKARQT